MFGRSWKPGRATIVAMKEVGHSGHDAYTGAELHTYEFVADVQPDGGGPVFRTVLHEPFNELHWRQPRIGQVVPVKCKPKHEKAKFDTRALADRDRAEKKAEKAAADAQFEAAAGGAPGTPPPS